MEMRGGNGYIEDWCNAKLVRDAHLGVIWEGTSTVNALDIVRRAVGKDRAHLALQKGLHAHLSDANIPGQFRGKLTQLVDRAVDFIDSVAKRPDAKSSSRKAATNLYHVTSAALMSSEGARLGANGGDARRLLMARLVIDHRLGQREDPFGLPDSQWENEVCNLLFDDRPVDLR